MLSQLQASADIPGSERLRVRGKKTLTLRVRADVKGHDRDISNPEITRSVDLIIQRNVKDMLKSRYVEFITFSEESTTPPLLRGRIAHEPAVSRENNFVIQSPSPNEYTYKTYDE